MNSFIKFIIAFLGTFCLLLGILGLFNFKSLFHIGVFMDIIYILFIVMGIMFWTIYIEWR